MALTTIPDADTPDAGSGTTLSGKSLVFGIGSLLGGCRLPLHSRRTALAVEA
jgi:hypothetical protein